MVNQCCVFKCRNNGGFTFPKDKNLRKRWIIAVRRDKWMPTLYSKVCEKHFTERDFRDGPTSSGSLIRKKRCLKPNVVPSVFEWNAPKTQASSSRKRQDMALKCEQKQPTSQSKSQVKDGTACSERQTAAENTQDLACSERKTAAENAQDLHCVEMERYCPVNQLKNIALDKNGTFMIDFDPEKSKREMRKLNRKIHKDNKKQNQMYDEKGLLLENSMDLCDCLDKDCPGCHFPCPKCSSEKCGPECRIERRWLCEQIEVEGTNLVFKWTATKLS